MGKQAEAFLNGAGDAWHERNKSKPRLPDPVLTAIENERLRAGQILEVGCGDGWRLRLLQKHFPGAECCGIEPSKKAATKAAQTTGLEIYNGDFPNGISYLGFTGRFNLIVFGFCLYLADRDELFEWIMLSDNGLADSGHIIIHDFVPDYPYRRAYAHKEGLWSYKMDYAKLWLAHPGYKEVRTDLFGEDDDRVGVTVIQKDFANAFPVREI